MTTRTAAGTAGTAARVEADGGGNGDPEDKRPRLGKLRTLLAGLLGEPERGGHLLRRDSRQRGRSSKNVAFPPRGGYGSLRCESWSGGLVYKKSKQEEEDEEEGVEEEEPDGDNPSRTSSGAVMLLRCASAGDRALMAVGCALAVLHGVSFPVLALVFGNMTNVFLNITTATAAAAAPAAAALEGQRNDSVPDESWPSGPPPADYLPALTSFMSQFSFYYVALGVTVLVAASIQVCCWELAAERLVHRMRLLFFAQVVRQDVAWFERKGAGDVATKISDDLERVREGVGSKLSMVVQYGATLVSGLAVGLLASWRLTVAVLAVGPVLVGASAALARVVATTAKEEQLRYAAAGGVASQALHGIRTVAAFGGQDREALRYERALHLGLRMAVTKYRKMSLSLAAVFFLTYAAYGLAFWYGAALIGDGLATPGAVFTVFFSVLAGAFSIGNSLPFIQAASTAAGAVVGVYAVVRRVPRVDPYAPHGLRPASVEGRIQFKSVLFRYPSRPTTQVLRDLTLTVQPGTTVALVGSSGAGKSTVVRLLLRFHDVEQGAVLLDGEDVRDLNVSWLRSRIGLVSQDPVLFATTILENIRLGRADATVADIEEAARMANAHEFITALPEGYGTLVGEGGTRLSGGQRQRVAIARALVRDPAVLLLDEATSALDAESEGLVQDALERAARGRTTLVIAHRVSTVRTADVIHAMRDGVVEESGSHDELMARGGLYSQLVAAQQRDVEEAAGQDDDGEGESSGADGPEPDQGQQGLGEEHSDDRTPPTGDCGQHQQMTRPWMPVATQDDAEEEETGKVDLNNVRLCRLFRIGRPELPWLLLGVAGCALTGSIMPVFAFFYGEVFNTFTLRGEALQQSAVFWASMFMVLAVVSAASWWMQIAALTVASERLVVRLRLMAFRNLLHQAVSWFDRDSCSPAKLVARLARDAPTVKAAAGWRVGQVVSALVTLSEALLVAFMFGWKLALVLVVAVPFIVVSYYQQSMVVRRHQRRDAELMAKAVQVATESVSNIQTVQALGKERHFYAQYSDFLLQPFREAKRHAYLYALVFALTQSLVYAMYAGAFRLGAYLIEVGEMTAIDVYRVFFALAFCAPQVGTTSAYLQDFNRAKLAVGLMLQLVDRRPDIDCGPTAGVRPVLRGKVSLRGVHFRYPARPDVEVLRGLTLDVEPGQTLALVGASGCGKSTVLALIERFYEPTKGAVLVDDMDIRSVNVPHLRAHIGLVTQDAALFDCSVRDNIAYGLNQDAAKDDHMADIIKAARTANIHDFIASLPQGYDTLVGEGGAQLSGGQRQRVAIARALVRDPAVLLLDEATSALDTETEKVVQEALERARRGRTCIVVAHRLSTVRNTDSIAVLHRGRVVEQGTHAQLVARQGRYHRLVSRQRL